MSTYTFGFIGTGNMGGALAKAVSKGTSCEGILLANRTAAKAEALAAELGCSVGANAQVAAECQYIFLGVKPQMMAETLAPLQEILAKRTDRFLLVTMAAGLTMERIAVLAGGDYPVIRIMPNTPCAIGEGMILYAANDKVSDTELRFFTDALSHAGMLDPLPEHLIDAGSAVAGCGPAYLCQIVEALADGGVTCGLPRQKALLYAAQMVKGTGALILQSGQHPAVLKDAVCSPGGSTIAGVRAMENGGVRAAMMEAVIAADKRNKELGK